MQIVYKINLANCMEALFNLNCKVEKKTDCIVNDVPLKILLVLYFEKKEEKKINYPGLLHTRE